MTNQQYREKIAAFSDFAPLPDLPKQEAPTRTPPNAHPRVGFTAKRLQELLCDVERGDNRHAYAQMLKLSDADCDGAVRDVDNHDLVNNARVVDCEIFNIILAKAFRYAADGDERYGYAAVYALKNYLATFDAQIERAYDAEHRPYYYYNVHVTAMEAMRVIGCVYDWCYPLLTDRDKRQLLTGVHKCHAKTEFPDFPPKKVGGLAGHASGALFLEGWLTVAIAVYNEYPDYFAILSKRILETVIPAQNYLLQSGFHGQGIAYGAVRLLPLLKADCWYSAMFDGKEHLLTESAHQSCLTFLKAIRPDGELLRIGDDFHQGRRLCYVIPCALFGASLYHDPILKGFAAHETNGFTLFWLLGMNPIDVLLFNDPHLPQRPLSDLPLATFYGAPAGKILAKTAHNDKNAGMVYMNIGVSGSGNHEHLDCGDFQIYHKGMLLASSGCYSNYGSAHDFGYYKQTISKNSILVYNPNMPSYGKWIYSGGQRIDPDNIRHGLNDLDDWMSSPLYNRATLLYGETCADKTHFTRACIAGDLTQAYDAQTVSAVRRHMVCLSTDDPTNPMVFILFDKITATDPSYKKTLLFHTQNTPTITPDCSIVTNQMSKLFIQSLLTPVEHRFVGGREQEFLVNGKQISCFFPERAEGLNAVYNTESGHGRLEVSPQEPSLDDRFLTVMYVGPHIDSSPFLNMDTNILQPFHRAVALHGTHTVGAAILGQAVVFAEDGGYITQSDGLTLPDGIHTCLLCGLEAGPWQVGDTVYTVKAGTHTLSVPVTDRTVCWQRVR